MVRINVTFPIQEALDSSDSSIERHIRTIKYLYHAGAKVLIASNWGRHKDTIEPPSEQTVADNLSSILQSKVMATNWISDCTRSKVATLNKADILLIENLSKFKDELANCSVFARKLSSGVDIFVNETFSQSHKILASTVGVPRYCYTSVAGFSFEEELSQIVGITRTTKHPYLAIIGGDNLNEKAAAVQFLASKCDGLVFVGMMAFQIMHAKGQTVPSRFVDLSAVKNSMKIVEYANKRNILVLLPKDFLCSNDNLPKQLHTFPAHGVLEGWEPVDLGPSSMTEISYVLSTCKKILSIGPLKFRLQRADSHVASKLPVLLETSSGSGCDVTVIGSAACRDFGRTSACTLFKNASVAWEFLKGSVLPGLTALDRAYPFEVDWEKVFDDPSQPLVVDIGSGNGLFLFEMARRQKNLNFLGLEMNKKLVNICLNLARQSEPKNRHFIATNATSTFRSIISSYPGEVVLVSIQCPNPDFNKPEHRWRMLQRSLVEAIVDLLTVNGKVFLQSDVESVAVRMRDQFIKYGKSKLAIVADGWLKENPYGVRSDWEQHVIDRGAPMYRLVFSKS
ncbi:phosphoglycerate kinase [Ranunculus cassubicifolius]